MEIERKYLLDKLPFDLSAYEKSELAQGYISTDPTIRLRKSLGESNEEYILTVKGSGMLSREEFELALSKEQFDRLWCKVETQTVCKTRYLIPIDNGLIAELDVYHEQLEPLLTVEVEFKSEEEAESFVAPEWFGRDVTLEHIYRNGYLAKYGLSSV